MLGDNTFGKGLVQTVYPLSENTGLALTTAKYYTPSGRLIQRDYSNMSFFDYYYRKNIDSKNPQDVKMTDSGRTVYGGGGITPDEKYAPPKLNRFQIELLRASYAFFNFTASTSAPTAPSCRRAGSRTRPSRTNSTGSCSIRRHVHRGGVRPEPRLDASRS